MKGRLVKEDVATTALKCVMAFVRGSNLAGAIVKIDPIERSNAQNMSELMEVWKNAMLHASKCKVYQQRNMKHMHQDLILGKKDFCGHAKST